MNGIFTTGPPWLQGCRIKGKAEKAVFSLKVSLYTCRLHPSGSDCCIESNSDSICHSSFKRVCLHVQAELQQCLRDLLKEAAVEHVEELLSANVAREWRRTARVNLLKMTVAEALAWLRSPPAVHKKWASLVCAPQLQLGSWSVKASL